MSLEDICEPSQISDVQRMWRAEIPVASDDGTTDVSMMTVLGIVPPTPLPEKPYMS